TVFALLVTLALAVFLWGDAADALGRLALPVALAGLAPLVVGAAAHQALADQRGAAAARTAGTAIALAGGVVLLLAARLAWPRPGGLVGVAGGGPGRGGGGGFGVAFALGAGGGVLAGLAVGWAVGLWEAVLGVGVCGGAGCGGVALNARWRQAAVGYLGVLLL